MLAPSVSRRLLPALALTLLVAGAGSAAAAVLTPTRTTDGVRGGCDHDCSLREAVLAANLAPGADVVLLGPGTYRLTVAGRGEEAAGAGDLDVTGALTILGAGADCTVIDAGGLDRVFDLRGSGSLELWGVTLRGGNPGAAAGGALRAAGAGSAVTVTRCAFEGNQVGELAEGGAIWTAGALEVRASTFADNAADGDGGAIAARGATRVVNSTLTHNGSGHGFGGAVHLAPHATLELTNATVSENMAMRSGGGIFVAPGGEAVVTRTILAGNMSWAGGPDCFGSVETGGHNLIGVGYCAGPVDGEADDRVGTLEQPLAAMLAPLAMNGGTTATCAPLAGSPAIDGGEEVHDDAACGAVDQRGEPRMADGDDDGVMRCDVGAFEVNDHCVRGPGALCLAGGRFRVTARYAVPPAVPVDAHAEPLTDDTGYFWFFRGTNVEVVAKVLDACGPFGRWWVFLSGLTDLGVEVVVEDTATGTERRYGSDAGTPFAPVQDTDAFATCG
jgi:CSLREA domain-containing protein